MPGFGPAAEVLLVRQKDPKPLTPRPVTSEWTDANLRRAGQLAALKQGPPSDESVRPEGRAAGVGHGEEWVPQEIQSGMAASTGMIKGKKPLEIIWNNYNMAITALALLQFLSGFLPGKKSIETFPSTICASKSP